MSQWPALVEALSLIQKFKSVRILFVGQPHDRPSWGVLETLKERRCSFNIVDYTEQNISHFIDRRLDSVMARWPNIQCLQSQISCSLKTRCQGMFHWVSLILELISSYGESEDDIRKLLDDFPVGLQATYIKVFTRLLERPQHIRGRIQRARKVLLAARATLTVQELRAAIRLEEVDDFNPSSANTNSPEDLSFIDSLGSLVNVTRIDSQTSTIQSAKSSIARVGLCHSSLRQLLLSLTPISEISCTLREAQARRFFATTEVAANSYCAQICLTVITTTYDDLCRQFYLVSRYQPPLIGYAWEF